MLPFEGLQPDLKNISDTWDVICRQFLDRPLIAKTLVRSRMFPKCPERRKNEMPSLSDTKKNVPSTRGPLTSSPKYTYGERCVSKRYSQS